MIRLQALHGCFRAPSTPVSVRIPLEVSGDVGTQFSLPCTVTSYAESLVTGDVLLELSGGLTTLTGQQSALVSFSVSPGASDLLSFDVVATAYGVHEIKVLATSSGPGGEAGGDLAPAYIGAGAQQAPGTGSGGLATLVAPETVVQQYSFSDYMPIQVADSVPDPGEGVDSVWGGPEYASQALLVTGRFVYVDPGGLTQPLVNASIHVWDADSWLCGDDDLLGTGVTDSEGRYSVLVDNGDCSGTVDIYVKAILENGAVRVAEPYDAYLNVYYFYTSTVSEAAGTTLDFGTLACQRAFWSDRALWIFEWVNRAWSRMYVRTGNYMRKETAAVGQWADQQTAGASKYKTSWLGGYGMFIDSGQAQSRDIVTHEWGHGVLHWSGDAVSGQCPSPHEMDGSYTTGCAWNEGFPDFLAVYLNDDDGDHYFDWGPQFQPRDLEYLNPQMRGYSHDQALRCEGNVAGALLDLCDSSVDAAFGNNAIDQYSGGFPQVMHVLTTRTCTGFQSFWSQWVGTGKPRHLPVQAIRVNGIDFNNSPVWLPTSFVVPPYQHVQINLHDLVSDQESLDSELTFHFTSISGDPSSVLVQGSVLTMDISTPSGVGTVDVVLVADDGLEPSTSTLRMVWSGTPGGKGGGPPPPCEYPCETPGDKLLSPADGIVSVSPNPFNPATSIAYRVASGGAATVEVFSVTGKRVRTLVRQFTPQGDHQVQWDGRDESGVSAASGVYLVRLQVRGRTFVSRAVLLK